MALQSLMDKLLFTEPFELEVNIPPEECAQRLESFHQPRPRFWVTSSRKAVIRSGANGIYGFDLRVIRYGRGLEYTSAKAVGRIETVNGKTFVRGAIQFGLFYVLVVVSVVLVFFGILMSDLSSARPASFLLFNVVVGLIAIYYGWTLFSDRSKLKQLFYAALDSTPPQ